MSAWNLGTSWEQSPGGLLGAHGVLGQGWQLVHQHRGGREIARHGPPSSHPLEPGCGAKSQAGGCQVEVGKGMPPKC